MKTRFIIFFCFYTLLFAFYPGDTHYFSIFSNNRDVFAEHKAPALAHSIKPYPIKRFPNYPSVSAQGVYVVYLPSFTPIFEKNPHGYFLPASTTKIITALVARDLYDPDRVITVKRDSVEGQSMGLVRGEKITAEYLLYGTLIHSGNDGAYALADEYGFDRYINLMNKKTSDLKMTSSAFKNPAGLDRTGQHTSPFDLALAARALIKDKYLAKIVSIKNISISDTEFKYFHQLSNVNQLLGELQGIGGLKTGYTEEAGENLVSFYKQGSNTYIIVVLKSEDRFKDTTTIVQWLNNNVIYKNSIP